MQWYETETKLVLFSCRWTDGFVGRLTLQSRLSNMALLSWQYNLIQMKIKLASWEGKDFNE